MSKQQVQNQATDIARPLDPQELINRLVFAGDLSVLTKMEQLQYYHMMCNHIGLDPLTKPFDLIQLDGKLVMYANKNCAEQLRSIYNISMDIISREETAGVFTVTARAVFPSGRSHTDIGCVYIKGMVGKELQNSMMKAATKAIRRATLAACGLGGLDLEPEDFDQSRVNKPESLTISNKGSGLDSWACTRGTAMRVLEACKACEDLGATEQDLKAKLPAGLVSRKELSEQQAETFIFELRSYLVDLERARAGNDA